MTRDKANELLALWRADLAQLPPHTITEALIATGDLLPMEVLRAAVSYRVPARMWNVFGAEVEAA